MKNNEPRRLMFVLTGSNQFVLQEGISESLAGRTAVINMSGFTQTEKRGISGSFFTVNLKELLNKQRDHKDFYRGSGAIFEDMRFQERLRLQLPP
ncbi:MAG: AAA family ATPase [Lachnospiraceae bacterium]|nr:AAA family ATPase [Lachnospiraceae bacterium]